VAKLANFRRENPVMIYGSFINIINSPDYWVYARKYFGKEVVVLINNNAENQKISFTLPAIFSESTFKSLFGKNYKIDGRKISIELGAYQTEVLYQEE
jgi:glycosidase